MASVEFRDARKSFGAIAVAHRVDLSFAKARLLPGWLVRPRQDFADASPSLHDKQT